MTPECLAEMIDWRKTLLEDFKISPDIVTNCADEIRDSCDGGLQREGKTLHCLMDLARPRARDAEKKTLTRAISTKCLRSVRILFCFKVLKDVLFIAYQSIQYKIVIWGQSSSVGKVSD